MIDLRKKLTQLADAEFALVTLRHEVAMAFCEAMLPDEVHAQVAAQRAASDRLRKVELLMNYYISKGK
jgi:hypothetical protein